MSTLAAIQTSAISKSYRSNPLRSPTPALHPTSLTIPQGSIFALLGHNGAGKTTLIKLLVNILRPTGGTASVLGRTSTSIAGDDFTRIGYVSENQDLPGWMTVRAFLRYQSGFYSTWDDANLIRRFELPLSRKLKHLSRGQRMKVALASVLAFSPSLIILDEPFSGLDPLVRDELIEALLDSAALKAATEPLTILLSSHDLAEIESFATHVAFLHAGNLLFAEELPALAARFREVTVTLGDANPTLSEDCHPEQSEGPASPGAATTPPPSWLNLQQTAHTLRFTHTQADTEPIEAQIRTLYPNATSVTLDPMNLRSIFLAIAKSGRKVEGSL
jgi:ABC-2 type transport system ATP-binding protein